jgi:hypothetical protein
VRDSSPGDSLRYYRGEGTYEISFSGCASDPIPDPSSSASGGFECSGRGARRSGTTATIAFDALLPEFYDLSSPSLRIEYTCTWTGLYYTGIAHPDVGYTSMGDFVIEPVSVLRRIGPRFLKTFPPRLPLLRDRLSVP